ncbi:MAG: hypothetical protein IRZ14_06895 [Chloroflexi bacterium]|nr:hypothetical protein [Chloroflexota bacterium]
MAGNAASGGLSIRERVRAYVAEARHIRHTATSLASRIRAHNVASVTEALEELVREGALQKEARGDREPVYLKGLSTWADTGRRKNAPRQLPRS